MVSLGGSDTHGVTFKVATYLKNKGMSATIILGPAFEHTCCNDLLNNNFVIKRNVPSLINEFYKHDVAITGGGITPFEANASGLPCIIIANELFEIPVALQIQEIGSSIFAGYHNKINFPSFKFESNIEKMSNLGVQNIGTNGGKEVYSEILRLVS